jgi:hypothetical protein
MLKWQHTSLFRPVVGVAPLQPCASTGWTWLPLPVADVGPEFSSPPEIAFFRSFTNFFGIPYVICKSML